ncbi:MAG: glycine cleavage system aminomethyltransferase GcvT [Myxococcota bacterium]|nr:glycine cleavage system aminomethyltransferase GcvT [Myxococcota bacterium]
MTLRRTPFFSIHQAAGARLIDFGGWEMPVQYEGILAEHKQVRNGVGLFDVSHMGEVRVRGAKALAAVDHLVTNRVGDLQPGQARYSPMCRPSGGIVDDLIVYKIDDDDVLICVNAANRAKDFDWMVANNPFGADAVFSAEHDDWAQVAVQGRYAEEVLQTLTGIDLAGIRYYWFAEGEVADVDGCLIARTGYTGEDGFEVFLPPNGASTIWPALMKAGATRGIRPIGLGARDTLRLEARMHLYGNDMDDETTPLEAGLAWAVKLDKSDFIGRDALVAQRATRPPRRLVGMVVQKRIARHGNPVVLDGKAVGVVTSGTRSPTLGTNIALAYVPLRLARPGTRLQVDVRGRLANAEVVKGPFFKRDY